MLPTSILKWTPILSLTTLLLAGCGGRSHLGTAHSGVQSSGAAPWGNSPGWSRPGQDGSCPEGTSLCGKGGGARCHHLENDPENCGACGNTCTLGIRCSGSACQQVQCTGALSMVPGPLMQPGPGAGSALVADVNGDGHVDIVTWDSTDRGQIDVRLGTGDGAFGSGTVYRAGNGPQDVVVGDFNEDGLLDLAVAGSWGSQSVDIWLGRGDGAITNTSQNSPGFPLNRLSAGDLNNDGHLDVVVSSGNITVLLGKGDGTLTKTGEFSAGEQPYLVMIRDWNGDGNPDLIALGSTLHVLLGKGNGTFGEQQDCAIAVQFDATIVADFNRDGKYDVATSLFNSARVSVLLGLGECRFSPATEYAWSLEPRDLTFGLSSGDLNGDGILDLVTASRTGQVLVLTGKGDGTFVAEPELQSLNGNPGLSLTVGDANGDGRADLIVSGATGVQVLTNTCP